MADNLIDTRHSRRRARMCRAPVTVTQPDDALRNGELLERRARIHAGRSR